MVAALRASAAAISADRRGLGLLLDPVARRVGRLADLGLELALGQRGLADGDLLLLGEDRLVAVGLGQRAGRGGLGGGGVGLGLDLGLLERQRPLGDRDLLLGGDRRLLGGLAGVRLGDPGGLADPRGLGPAEVGEVAAVVGDVLDLERVEDQPLPVSEVSDSSATRWANAARSRMICSTVRPPTIERSAPASTSWVNGSTSSCWLRNRCAAEPDLVGVAADLDDGDAVDVQLDALARRRRRGSAPRSGGWRGPWWRASARTGSRRRRRRARPSGRTGRCVSCPVSGLSTALPLRPVTMNAWLGPATL